MNNRKIWFYLGITAFILAIFGTVHHIVACNDFWSWQQFINEPFWHHETLILMCILASIFCFGMMRLTQ